MGYSYDLRGRLACDSCGSCGQTRKRTCPARVRYAGGGSLPYCQPAALCPACYQRHKATLHAGCREGAAKRTAEEAAKQARLAAGELEVAAAWGSWQPTVPEGYVGVCFRGLGGAEVYRLIRKAEYDPSVRRYLSEYAETGDWRDPHGPHCGATLAPGIVCVAAPDHIGEHRDAGGQRTWGG